MHDPPRILIVDDHETNRDILAKRLATQGYDLCQATDGQEALDAAKTLHPDLILLDVMMPKRLISRIGIRPLSNGWPNKFPRSSESGA